MHKFIKKIALGAIALLLFSNTSFAVGINTSVGVQTYTTLEGSVNVVPIDTTYEQGSTSTRWAKMWTVDLDVSGIFTFGGVMGSSLDMDGYNLILDQDADTALVNDRDVSLADDEFAFDIAGARDFKWAANLFTALSGSSVTIEDGGLNMGTSTADGGPITLVQGAQTGDPQTIIDLTADANGDFSITTDTGDVSLVSADDVFLTTTDGEVQVDAKLNVVETLPAGASVGHLIQGVLGAGNTYTGTTAGLTVKNYDADATVDHDGGENSGLAIFYKQLSAMASGGESSIITAHTHSSTDQKLTNGMVMYPKSAGSAFAVRDATLDYGYDLADAANVAVTTADFRGHEGEIIFNDPDGTWNFGSANLVSAGALTTGSILVDDGTVSAPSISFTNDTDTGFYRSASNQFRAVAGDSFSALFAGNLVQLNNILSQTGSVLSLKGATADGATADAIVLGAENNFVTAGAKLLSIVNNSTSEVAYIDYLGSFNAGNGTSSLPAYSFKSDPDTGLYSNGSNSLAIATGGTLSVAVGSSLITVPTEIKTNNATIPMLLTSRVVDGVSAVAFTMDSDNTLSTAGAKIASFTNNSVEKAYIDYIGEGNFAGVDGGSSIIQTTGIIRGGSFKGGNNLAVVLNGDDVDDATGIGVVLNAGNVLTTAGSKLASFQNNTVEKAYIDYLGDYTTTNGVFHFAETTTPTAVADYGALYTKTDNALYFQDGGGTEHQLGGAVTYGEFKIADNAVATEMRATAEWQALTTNVVTGLQSGFTYDAGQVGEVASIADAGGGDITITDVAHGLVAGDIITMNGHTDAEYNGLFEVKSAPTTDTFTVTATYTATDTGYWQQGSSITVGVGGAGVYEGSWSSTGIAATNGHVFDFAPVVNVTVASAATARRSFSSADYGSFGGTELLTLAEGDVVSFVARNNSASGNITIRGFDLNLHRL